MESILRRVSSHWEAHNSLEDAVPSSELIDLLESPITQAAIGRLFRDEIGLAELGTNIDRGKVSRLCTFESWSISLIKDYSSLEQIALSPYPMIVMPFSKETTITINNYRANERIFSKSRVMDEAEVEILGTQTLKFGEFWVTSTDNKFSDISDVRGDHGQTLILIVIGPPFYPYTHVFDRSLHYISSSFSASEYNSRVFFSDFLKEIFKGGIYDILFENEKIATIDYMKAIASDHHGLSEEVWPVIQALSIISPNDSIDALKSIANSDHELSGFANSTLQRNGISL